MNNDSKTLDYRFFFISFLILIFSFSTSTISHAGGEKFKIFQEVSSPLNKNKMRLELIKANEEYKKSLSFLKSPLSTEDKAQLDEWVAECESFNDALRSDLPDEGAVKLEKALIKHPPFRGKVYRTSRTSVFKDGAIEEGDVVLDKGFLATSSSPEYVKEFYGSSNNSIFVIQPKGSAYSIANVRGDQAEVLFRPKTPFTVKKIQEINGKTYVHLEETDKVGWSGIKNIHTGEKYLNTCSST